MALVFQLSYSPYFEPHYFEFRAIRAQTQLTQDLIAESITFTAHAIL